MEQDNSCQNREQPNITNTEILPDMPTFEQHIYEKQIAEKTDKIAQIQDAFPDAIVTFDSARQLLYKDYTGEACQCESQEIGFILPRYEIRQYEQAPPNGYEVNYDGYNEFGQITGAEMLKVNDMLMRVRSDKDTAFQSDENISFFGMGKDAGIEGQDWKYITMAGLDGKEQKIKVETLPAHIDNTLFWALYNTGGKVSEHSAKEARKILKMVQYLTDSERERLSKGFITENYIPKLEYLAMGGNLETTDFEPSSSREELETVKENAEDFLKNQPEMESRRLELIDELKTAVDENKLKISFDGEKTTISGLSLESITALDGYEDEAAKAAKNSSSGDEFIKNLMADISQDDVYRIVFRLIPGE